MKYHNNEYTIVTEPPLGYEIWNIKDAPNGCLPFCRLKMMQPFGGAREIEPDTLKAMKCDGAQVILDAIGFGPQTSDAMQKYIAKNGKKEGKEYKVPYPFDCNRFADELNKKSNEKERLTPAQRLFFWTEYKNLSNNKEEKLL